MLQRELRIDNLFATVVVLLLWLQLPLNELGYNRRSFSGTHYDETNAVPLRSQPVTKVVEKKKEEQKL